MDKNPFPLMKAADIAALSEDKRVHQFNDNAVRHTKSLSEILGLNTIGVHLVRLESERDSTEFHFHHNDEEFIYILSGSGVAEIGNDTVVVEAGDFMGFTQHSLPHSMHNPNIDDLVYLMGGSRCQTDVCDYPKLKRRMYRIDGKKQYVELDQLHDV